MTSWPYWEGIKDLVALQLSKWAIIFSGPGYVQKWPSAEQFSGVGKLYYKPGKRLFQHFIPKFLFKLTILYLNFNKFQIPGPGKCLVFFGLPLLLIDLTKLWLQIVLKYSYRAKILPLQISKMIQSIVTVLFSRSTNSSQDEEHFTCLYF